MAKSAQYIHLDKPNDYIESMMNKYLQDNNFVISKWRGDTVYRAGEPVVFGYKYLKWYYSNGILQIEAWISDLLGQECDLDHSLMYKASLQELVSRLEQPLPPAEPYYAQPYIPPNMTSGPQPDAPSNTIPGPQPNAPSNTIPGPQPDILPNTMLGSQANKMLDSQSGASAQNEESSNAATVSLVFGILSIVFCFNLLFSIIFGIIGLTQSKKGMSSDDAPRAECGRNCSIIGLCLSPVAFFFELGIFLLTIFI